MNEAGITRGEVVFFVVGQLNVTLEIRLMSFFAHIGPACCWSEYLPMCIFTVYFFPFLDARSESQDLICRRIG